MSTSSQISTVFATVKQFGPQLESRLIGHLPEPIRYNLRTELLVGVAFGAFHATALAFIPVVLRRSGATPQMLAVYTSLQFLGSVLTAFSIVLMRRRRTLSVVAGSWFLARLLFLLFALIVDPVWMIVLSSIFWVFEVFPNPGYTRILQSMYPNNLRGQLMSLVRVGRIGAVILVTPLAGWALDQWGYRILFPIGSLFGLLSIFFFLRLRVDEGPLPPRKTKTLPELWLILRTDKRFAYYLLSFVVYGMGTLMSWTIYPLVQVDRLGLSYSTLGLMGLVQSIFWLVGYLFWGRLVDQKGGVTVVRSTCAIAMFIPLIYSAATTGWILWPAFVLQGLINAGWDMGLITAGIQLADSERVSEYAAIQATIVGLRGMIAPIVGVALMDMGLGDNGVFILSTVLMITAWVMFGFIKAPVPEQGQASQNRLMRYRWPLRIRTPRL